VDFALLALLLVVLALLIWRAVTRERRDYARFKRLWSTTARRQVFRRWLVESWLVLGGLAVIILIGVWAFVPRVLDDTRAWGPLATIDYDGGLVRGILIGVVIVLVVGLIAPILLLRTRLDEVPTVGDIRALLPRNRGELPYGAGLALTAGVVEELLFRLALPALLFGVLGNGPLAFGLAALLFGALHLYQGPLGITFAFLLGLLFTALYVLSGSILLPIALHALIDLRSLVLIPVALGKVWNAERTVAS
jgi:membrane protease YdiL (CAAX protease family)